MSILNGSSSLQAETVNATTVNEQIVQVVENQENRGDNDNVNDSNDNNDRQEAVVALLEDENMNNNESLNFIDDPS